MTPTQTLDRFPVELKQRKQWVVWKYVTRDGKPTKVPFQPSGKPASSTEPATWSTFKAAIEATGYEGTGYVFQDGGAYIGIDLDGCRDPATGKLDQWAKDVVVKFGTYAEVSPSGSGVKLFGLSDSRWRHRHNVKLQLPAVGGKDPGVEVYDGKRFFCVTGRQLKGMSELKPVDDHLDWLAEQFGMVEPVATISGTGIQFETPIIERAIKYVEKMEPSVSGQAGHNKCFAAACALVMGFGLTEDEALIILRSAFNPRCAPPWSEKELQHKVRQATRQPGSRGYLRDARPNDWHRVRMPATYREQKTEPEKREQPERQVITLRHAADMYLADLASGRDMLIDSGIPLLDMALGGGMALGEMVIVGARPSHGKSAIGLQMAHSFAANGYPVVIVSEEMSAIALGKRTVQFVSSVPEEYWRHEMPDVKRDLDKHFASRKDVYVIERAATVEAASAHIEEYHNRYGCKVAIVDYAQLLDSSGRDRYEKISKVSTGLKSVGSKLGILVVVMAQLNRSVESRKEFVPMMSDIKESGQFEQDADVILFGVWPHRLNDTKPANEYIIYVCKNRNRAIRESTIKIEFDPPRQMLTERQVKSEYSSDFTKYSTREF